MTEYEATQRQRYIERQIRRYKREVAGLDAAGIDCTDSRNQLAKWQKHQRDFIEQTGLKRDYSREAVEGYSPNTKKTEKSALNAKKTVAKGEKSGIIKESNKNSITIITDGAVENVPNLSIDGYTEEQCEFICDQHKELLKYSRDNNDNKEVAFIFSGNLIERQEYIGSDDMIDLGQNLYGNNLFIMHNHPRNGGYSVTDMIFFIKQDNVKSFSIVKNDGTVEILTKSDTFNPNIFKKDFARIIKKTVKTQSVNEYNKEVDKLLRKYSREGGMIKWIK